MATPEQASDWLRDINYKQWLTANPNGTREEYDSIRARESAAHRQYEQRRLERQVENSVYGIVGFLATLFTWLIIPVVAAWALQWLTATPFIGRLIGVYIIIIIVKLYSHRS